jgi:hypothetical protein
MGVSIKPRFMQMDPISAAVRSVSETRLLLEQLIISSERFDYHKAKESLRLLTRKAQELQALQKALEAQLPNHPNVVRIPPRAR